MGLVRQIAPRNVVSARNASVRTRYDYDTDGAGIRSTCLPGRIA